MNNTPDMHQPPAAPFAPMFFEDESPKKQRVRQRARGVGSDYIPTEPYRVAYNHQYTYKTFTPMFIFVIVMMVIFYYTVV